MFRYTCPLVSLQYSVLDPDTLKRLHRSKKQLIEMERLANKVNVVIAYYDREKMTKLGCSMMLKRKLDIPFQAYFRSFPSYKSEIDFISASYVSGPEKACQP